MKKISLNNKTFALISNSENGEVSNETLFYYKQEKDIVHATYNGGSISIGHIVGHFFDRTSFNLMYHCVTTNGDLKAGSATAKIVSLPDGRLKLELEWQWLTGDKSTGKSAYIETEQTNQIVLFENHLEHLPAFIEINEEWVKNYFQIEDADRKLAANPEKVIQNGGFIFSLATGGQVVGVCALFCDENGVFELARMAVRPAYQRQGFGQKLMDAAISKLRQIKAKKVYLLSNTKLESAINLYRKNGFSTVTEGKHPVYSRCNIIMEKYDF